MRLVDRLLVILLGLLLIGIVTVLVLVPESVIAALEGIQTVNLFPRLVFVVVANILILIFLYFQLRVRRQPSEGLEVKASGAFTDVNVESAQALILNAVNAVPNVAAADATVKAVDGRADVDLHIRVSGKDVSIPQKQKEVNRALRQVINKQLGLRMRGRPRVHMSLAGEQPAPGAFPQSTDTPPATDTAQPDVVALPKPELEMPIQGGEIGVADTEPEDSDPDQESATTFEPEITNDDWLNNHLSKPSDEDRDASSSKQG